MPMYTLEQLIHFARNNEAATAPDSDRVFISGNTRCWGETADALQYLSNILALPPKERFVQTGDTPTSARAGAANDA
jgi:hypothetical protein